VKRLLLQNVCDLSNNMNGLRSVFRKVWKRKSAPLHHYVPDLHRRMLLATLWNTYICINEALALTLSDFFSGPAASIPPVVYPHNVPVTGHVHHQ
jgi:hypothetical protein